MLPNEEVRTLTGGSKFNFGGHSIIFIINKKLFFVLLFELYKTFKTKTFIFAHTGCILLLNIFECQGSPVDILLLSGVKCQKLGTTL